MNKFKRFFKVMALAAVLVLPQIALAVTQKEMEQARTIATKAYLRYANDGSGYLDDINPTTMAELESALKNKEKENIVAFKAIPVPGDYQNWDKEKLVEYWAVTAFQNSNLLEKGKGGRLRARKYIEQMSVTAPSAVATAQEEAPAEQPSPEPAAQETAPAPEPVKDVEPQVSPEELEANLDEAQAELDAFNQNPAAVDPNLDEEPEDNYTWVYIMVLGILVAIVLALVVYAANVMKKSGKGRPGAPSPQVSASNKAEVDKLRSAIQEKNAEIDMLNKRLEAASRQNSELKTRLETLTSELAMSRAAAPSEVMARISEEEVVAPEGAMPRKSPLRSIYLGRANAKGIFVRADRTLNVGNSVFVLDTTDGFSGSFRVADSPAAWSLALSNPREYLETACTGHDLDDTADASAIINESSGTAVFEGGCWRVIRKARIRYE